LSKEMSLENIAVSLSQEIGKQKIGK